MAEPDRDDQSGLGSAAQQMRAAEPYISAVWKLVGGAFFGVGAGYLLDRWLGTKPWLMVTLSVIGIAVGFYGFIRTMLRMGQR